MHSYKILYAIYSTAYGEGTSKTQVTRCVCTLKGFSTEDVRERFYKMHEMFDRMFNHNTVIEHITLEVNENESSDRN